ncbi:Filamentation induced by cAMP protein Fic [hydrothermal vent metagenome]|uniref:Filamentation induced by cAMP protein Fic n=1 Tax=hydrothermal vent metagenome TaxID=652676 RepID=A0A3B0ZV07_9ZZZZ
MDKFADILLPFWVIMGIFPAMTINTDTLKITPEILSLVAELDEFKGAWRALGTLAPERLLALRRVAAIESIGSSTRIEGSRLSDQEVAQLLNNIRIKKFDSRDEQEAAGYADVMNTVYNQADSIELTENHIRQLHRDLLTYSSKDERHRGNYKTNPNNVSAFDEDGNEIGVVFETATPFDTPRLMAELVDWTRKALEYKELHPLLVTAVFTVTFLAIHPFQDGNGRLSRILTTLLLLRAGYAYVPYSSLESVIEQSKQGYYLTLRNTQGTIRTDIPDWQPWVLYFLRALKKQKQWLETKIEREQILLARLPELSVNILELTTEHGRLTVSQIVELTGANRNTVKKHLQALVASQQLVQHGKGKGTWYGRI